jgi:long-chain acyl-CoA synthetase
MSAPDTIPVLLARRASCVPDANAFYAFEMNGTTRAVSWSAFAGRAADFAGALCAQGVGPGDRVAILAPTSVEWEVTQLGSLEAGACVAGIDLSYPDELLAAVLESVAPTVIIAESVASFARIPTPLLDAARLLVALRPHGTGRIVSLSDLTAQSRITPTSRPLPEDFAIITFSSGTTGRPKPIAYTHAQVVAAIRAILSAFPEIEEGAHLMCWLPLANLFQRIINFCAIECGAVSYVVEDPRDVMNFLPKANPDLLIGVPRFFEKLQSGIQGRLEGSPFVGRLARWALAAGAARGADRDKQHNLLVRAQHALADRIVLRRVRGVFGSRLKFLVSGSAPMPLWLLEWFEALGLPVLEAYGVSENIVPVAINTLAARKLGAVGRPLPPNEIKITNEGEILVRGPGVFSGYLEGGVLAPAALTSDGFWPTGDCGAQDADDYLSVSGRKSELFKLSTGRWVVPGPIEERLRRAPGVDQAILLGAGKKVTVALILVSPETRGKLGGFASGGSLSSEEERALRQGVEGALGGVPSHARPAGLLVTTSGFSVAGGELTSNLKLRRYAIEAKYRQALDNLFAGIGATGEAGLTVRYA